MKLKSTLLLSGFIALAFVSSAQEVVVDDNFEITPGALGGGYPASFAVVGQKKWNGTDKNNPIANPNTNPGLRFDDIFCDNSDVKSKTYDAAIVAEERTGGTGAQCLKINMTQQAFTDLEKPDGAKVSLRTKQNSAADVFDIWKASQAYQITLWVKADKEGRDVFRKQVTVDGVTSWEPILTAGTTWQQYSFVLFSGAGGNNALRLPIQFANNGEDYTIWIDDIKIEETNATSVDRPEFGKSIEIYPNPTTDVININCPADQFEVQLFNVSGKMVKQFPMGANHQVDISDLKKGVYVVAVSSAHGKMQKKMVKR